MRKLYAAKVFSQSTHHAPRDAVDGQNSETPAGPMLVDCGWKSLGGTGYVLGITRSQSIHHAPRDVVEGENFWGVRGILADGLCPAELRLGRIRVAHHAERDGYYDHAPRDVVEGQDSETPAGPMLMDCAWKGLGGAGYVLGITRSQSIHHAPRDVVEGENFGASVGSLLMVCVRRNFGGAESVLRITRSVMDTLRASRGA